MKFNKILLALSGVAIIGLTSCGGPKTSSARPTLGADDMTQKRAVNMSVMYQGPETRIRYGGSKVSFPYQAADGKTYNSGDLKPVWAAVQEKLNITINDKADSAASTIANNFATLQATQFAGVDIAQGSSSDIINEGTTNSTIVDLSKYLGDMPNFAKFLEENPIVKTNIKDANGSIFYAPYFDGYNDLERMLMMREDWVKLLLDGDEVLDTTKTLTSHYKRTMPKGIAKGTSIKVVKADGTGTENVTLKYDDDKGIIDLQNALTTKNGSSLTTALRNYIDSAYGGYYTKRSDLFIGQNAAYNVDELVALYRCVLTNPLLLTGDANKNIVPLYPRDDTNDRTADLWRFTQFFGVRGGESRNGYLYVDKDGKINDARDNQDMANALQSMHEMFQEGLIMQDFTNEAALGNKTEYRAELANKNLGFSIYDYNQTTTAFNDTVKKTEDPKMANFKFVSVLPAVADWKDNGKYFHFTESWRSVKSEGWFITQNATKNADIFRRCLTIFDYFYSPEGNTLMSYGPDGYIAKNADGTFKTMDYQGKQVPVLSDATKAEIKNLASSNYTNYYRFWLGATYPIGYIKQQGMEFQTVSASATESLNYLNKAIVHGVLQHINVGVNKDHFYDMIPTTFSFSKTEQASLVNFSSLDALINNTKGKSNIWSEVIKKGFGVTVGTTNIPSLDKYVTWMRENSTNGGVYNVKGYEALYNVAYKRMIA